ncbi:hypothetical protein A2442_01375 [Candidatus Campbellbacteria bacterium RIFOXYC2_FULL_35_25]|uniref:Helix-turn-helix type 11 domain-containing protein n=1 Tax=Candidatus Campbellbacteria bacterium RIFOXYC2_FULL_35_25 TaxID=1797582 RepID=A0A1F5EHT0_9BACT|nr:MAG: hypothetical protein A2442_01375 [Candidatus Campbellbacteria bacterium RIFOXYC2_FULL_35_25]
MPPEENQKNTVEEIPVSAPPKQEVVENVPVVEETPAPIETLVEEQTENIENIENVETEVVEPIIIESVTETPIIETTEPIEQIENEETGLLHFVRKDEAVEEIPQVEEVKQSQSVQQEQPQPQSEPQPQQTQTVEKIIYQTPPNLIQNLLTKARAKIQERKNKKLNKIMSLFESNSNISNSDVQKLLRTTKRSATRYLNILEKEQKIIQVGNAGRGVKYIKKP